MPTYEYKCTNCNHRFEVWQKMADEPLTICPECNGSIRRVLFPAGIVFKGSGFYKTDHRSGTAAADASPSETAPKESAPKAEGASESKETKETKETKTGSEKSSSTPAASSEKQVSTAAD